MIIYRIINKINGKMYVGQTTKTLKQRWQRHCWQCTHKYNSMPIAHAIKKYGKENLEIEVLCECSTLDEANIKEKEYAIFYNTFSPNGYNLLAGERKGFMLEETKEKLRKANLGKKRSQETKEKLRISHLGHVVSQETKRKISIKNKGRKTSELAKDRNSEVSSKHYDLIDPQGNVVHIHGMRKFCMDNEYGIPKSGVSKMCELVNSKRKSYRGWRLYST